MGRFKCFAIEGAILGACAAIAMGFASPVIVYTGIALIVVLVALAVLDDRGPPSDGQLTLFDMGAVDYQGRQSPAITPKPLYCTYAVTPCGRTTNVRAWGDLH